MKEKQFFEGLNSPKQKEYEQYLIDSGRYSTEELEKGRKKLEKWKKEDWQAVQAAWESLLQGYVQTIVAGRSPASAEAQDLVRRHFNYLKRFGIEVKKEDCVERARFHLGHPDWKKLFDTYHPQLLDFILAAIEEYAK